jgi:hypothetical protein
MEKAEKILKESLELVRANCSEGEYKAYRSGIAQIDGRLFFLLMEPIYCQHPSLIPPDTPPYFVERWSGQKPSSDLNPGTK